MWQGANATAVGHTPALARAAHAAPHTPVWAIVVGISVCVLLAMFWVGLALVRGGHPPRHEGDDDHGSGPSGGGPGPPDPDGGDAPGGAPAWWADFEREFAAYVSEREMSIR